MSVGWAHVSFSRGIQCLICEGDSNDLKVYQGVQMVKIGEQITINLNNTSAARTVGLL